MLISPFCGTFSGYPREFKGDSTSLFTRLSKAYTATVRRKLSIFSIDFTLKEARVSINQYIRAKELRVIDAEGENLGVIPTAEALRLAEEAGLDLIEISPMAQPPVAKIMDYGKYQYTEKKKAKEVKAKSHVTETKGLQVKIGTGEHDLALKAKRAAEWLGEGHRVKVDLFLWGRYKYMEESFLKERLSRFLKIIPAEYRIADEIKRSPKGFSTTLERVTPKNAKGPKETDSDTNHENK